jgi:hypothetical protein
MERFLRFSSSGNERQGAVKKALRMKRFFVSERLLGHVWLDPKATRLGVARIDG